MSSTSAKLPKMTRTGRPPSAGVARKRQFAVRVTPDEEREVLELASKAGLSVSEWLRAAVLAAKMYSRNPEALAIGFYPDSATELRRVVSPDLAAAPDRSPRQRGASDPA